MLRLLLVEDERYLREQMLSQVPWKTFGIGEVRGAADSDEAFSLRLRALSSGRAAASAWAERWGLFPSCKSLPRS